MSTSLETIRWPRLIFSILVTTVGALSVHSIMLQGLHVPFPNLSTIAPLFKFVIRAIAMFGLMVLGELTSLSLRGSFIKRVVGLFLIDAMLTESLLRGPFMDGYCTTAWIYVFVDNVPRLLAIAVSCTIVVALPKLYSLWQKTVIALALTALVTYIVNPLTGWAMQPVMHSLAGLAPQNEWCTLPYGANVLVPAYATFVEPVIACFAAAALTWNQLSVSRSVRYLQFALLILAIKNQLVTPLIYAASSKAPSWAALASDGQFALEALALAILTAFSWDWLRIRKNAETP